MHERRKKLKCNLNYTVRFYIIGQMQLTLFTEVEIRLSYEKRGSKMTNDVRDCKAKAKYCEGLIIIIKESESESLLTQYKFTKKFVLRRTVTNIINDRLIIKATKAKNTLNTHSVLLSQH